MEVYWQPWSEWNISHHRLGRRNRIALDNALLTYEVTAHEDMVVRMDDDPASGASYTFKRFESEPVPGNEHARRIRLVPQSTDVSHESIELGEENDGIRLLARFVGVVE